MDRLVMVIMVFFSLLLTHCGELLPIPAAPDPSPPAGAVGPHFLLSATGPVELSRDGWNGYRPVAFGTVLYPTDLLRVQGKARVLCAGSQLEVKLIPAGEYKVPCPFELGILSYGEAQFIVAGARDINKTIPYLLYPRNTLLLNDRPTARWHDTGASSYTVELMQPDQEDPIWKRENVKGDSLAYPPDEPALATGTEYRIKVTDNDSQVSSDDDESPGTAFRLAAAAERREIEAGSNKILSVEELTDQDRNFALGVYYAGLKIFPQSSLSPLGEAWLLLEPLAQTQAAPAIHLWYGEVLDRLLLPGEAQNTYQKALDNARSIGDLESEAVAHIKLWRLTNKKEHLCDARNLFQELGDQTQLQKLSQGGEDPKLVCN